MTIDEFAEEVRFVRVVKKYGDPVDQVERKLLLAISEVCEAHETMRDGQPLEKIWFVWDEPNGVNGKPEGFLVECADGVMRLLDIMNNIHQRLGGPKPSEVLMMKLEFNRGRPEKNGRQF